MSDTHEDDAISTSTAQLDRPQDEDGAVRRNESAGHEVEQAIQTLRSVSHLMGHEHLSELAYLIRNQRREIEARALTVFCPNERVVVKAANHGSFEGVVQKINRDMLTVLGDDGRLYPVSPSLCRHYRSSRSG